MQILFEDEHNSRATSGELTDFIHARLNNPEAEEFALSLILGVRRKLGEIDQEIEQIAQNWSVKRMASTDRNVLRLGAFEVLYGDTPFKVAVNEAVELAKRFGSGQSAQFVNGILDKLKK